MTTNDRCVIRLQIHSSFEMLDFVQLVSDELGHLYGLEEDAVHWIGVSIRESVINAIKHGNRLDEMKTVTIDFSLDSSEHPRELIVSVRDQGMGFQAEEVADPLAPENLLKSSGRGIFFMRSFMDDVEIGPGPEGGTEVRMVKKLGHAS